MELKYLKYKKKYLELKGGSKYLNKNYEEVTLYNDTEWIEITNNGQQNCGIYTNKTNDKILKCINGNYNNELISYVTTINQYFPKIHSNEYKSNLDKTFIIMDKLDSDITSIFFEILPKIALNKTIDECEAISLYIDHSIEISDMNDETNNKYFLFNIFKLKTPATMIEKESPYIKFNNDIKIVNQITFNEYNIFINKIKILFSKFFNFIMIEIINLLYELYTLNFLYKDLNFDNFGFKLLNDDEITEDIKTHYKCKNKFLGKNLYIYILNWDSGLAKITDEDKVNNKYLNRILNSYDSMSCNGQYNIKILGINKDTGETDKFTDDIKRIFNTFYNYNDIIKEFEEILINKIIK